MCSYEETFQANLDYWIFGRESKNKNEVIENLLKLLRFGINEPDSILIDVARSVQKIEKMTEIEFNEKNNFYPFEKKYEEIFTSYGEHVQIQRELESHEK